ncbi:sensor domain-containing protein [Mycolicibacterium sp. Dal123E01]|uniref:sensor domain-containing protein n=1 Tax=Mycolicibacterium sp. Dal123E01 TaxID=3457578 RepID=UPI00403EF423
MDRFDSNADSALAALLIESSPDLICRVDRAGHLLSVNSTVTTTMGYEANDLVGQHFSKLIHFEDLPERAMLFATQRRSRGVTTFECRHIHKSGEVRYLEWAVSRPGADGVFTAIGRDVTARKATEVKLRQERDYADAILASLPGAFYHFDQDGYVIRWNHNLEHTSRYSAEEVARMHVLDFIVDEDKERVAAAIQEALRDGETRVEADGLRKDGARTTYLFTAMRFEYDGRAGFLGVAVDLAEQKRIEDALRAETAMFEAQLESAQDGVLVLDSSGRTIIENKRVGEIWGLPEHITREGDPTARLSFVAQQTTDPDAFLRKVAWATEHPEEITQGEVELLDGTVVERYSGPVRDRDGHLYGRIVAFRDITDRRHFENRLRYLATHDDLTGLPNRSQAEADIERLIEQCGDAGRRLGLLYIDLDRFKTVNDGYGHPFGDQVLKAAGERLATLVRSGDMVARYGGDEFVALLPDLGDAADARAVAHNIVDSFAHPVVVTGREVHLSGSIGVSIFPEDGRTPGALLQNADIAMFRAKLQGRNMFAFYSREIGRQTQERLDLEARLRGAVAADQLRLAYQPKVSLATRQVTGCEALLRWDHPELGAVSPARFIPVAEESGLIVPIGDWVLRTACAQARTWLDAGLPTASVAVNVSGRQILEHDVVDWVARTLEATGLPPANLELELTESMVTGEVDRVIAVVDRLRALGVRTSIDDFGSGYTSLAYLRRFRVDTLKIDQSFVRSMLVEREDAIIVRAVISLAHDLGVTVVAEGVESEEQAVFLAEAGCDQVQGFYFSRPVWAEDFERLVRSDHALPLADP